MSTTPIDYTALAKQAGAVSSQPAPTASSSAPVDYTALAKQAGAVSSQPAPSTPDQGILSKVGDFAKGTAEGAVGSMADTISNLPWVGKKILSPEAMAAEREYFKPGSAAEKFGQTTGDIAEPILEFVLGDEALKGLALADKIGLASKLADFATKNPYAGKLLQHGVNAARMGTVGTAEALAKGATPGEAVKTGVATGIGGEALSAVTEPVANAIKNPFRTARAVAGAVSDAARPITSKFTGSEIQPTLKTGIQDVWNDVATKAGVPKPSAASVQDLGQEVGDSILSRSKANYRMIDTATEGRFSGTEKALKDVNKSLQSVTNDTEEQALLVRKNRLEMQMDQMMDEAATKGVSQAHVDAAKRDFKQAQAIYDTNHQIRMSTTGVRPGMQGAADVPEEVNSKGLMNRLNKLYNKGRLQQAVGDDGAEDLIGHSANAQKAARNVARNRTAAKIVGGSAAGAAGTAYELSK
jgi:hypothetical protein